MYLQKSNISFDVQKWVNTQGNEVNRTLIDKSRKISFTSVHSIQNVIFYFLEHNDL